MTIPPATPDEVGTRSVGFERGSAVEVCRATPEQWPAVKKIRLRALADSPRAFGSTLAREVAFEDQRWQGRVAGGTWFLAWSAEPGRARGTGHRGAGVTGASTAGDVGGTRPARRRRGPHPGRSRVRPSARRRCRGPQSVGEHCRPQPQPQPQPQPEVQVPAKMLFATCHRTFACGTLVVWMPRSCWVSRGAW